MSALRNDSNHGARNLPRLPNSGRAKSCTMCRQSKLRCDVVQVYPESCTRCKTRNSECKLDPSFKRMPMRGRLEQITKKLNHLQHALVLDQRHTPQINHSSAQQDIPAQSNQATGGSSGVARLETTETISSSSSGSSTSCFGLDILGDDFSAIESKQLGDVFVTGETVGDLFLHFYSFRHRHLPIISTQTSVNDLYNSSPILFWTIIVVSSHQNPHHSDLHLNLEEPYKNLLSTLLIKPITSLKTLQAILLLCLWPFSVKHQHEEPSLNLCGLAINAGLQMGLHQPSRLSDYKTADRTSSNSESIMTWMACFEISTILSSHLGLPPTLSSDLYLELIRSMCRNPAISRTFSAQVEIERHVARYIATLDTQREPHSRYSITQLLDNDLDAIRSEYTDSWSEESEFHLLGSKVYLCAFCFTPQTVIPSSYEEQSHSLASSVVSTAILYKGFESVIRLVEVFSGFTNSPLGETLALRARKTPFDHRIFYPKLYYRTLFFAACFLLFFLSKASAATEEDKTLVQQQLDAIHQMFVNVSNSSEHKHAAKNIQAMKDVASVGIQNSDHIVRTRLGASIFFNAIRATKALKPPKSQRLRNCTTMADLELQQEDSYTLLHQPNSLAYSSDADSEISGRDLYFPWNLWDNPLLQSGSDLNKDWLS
ncbi:hypothetical protein N431DRAFT_406474 [Stipitochalara longipes BDJ]|nr:hypothetical protein N431DRAFT_406474 [Stipitochalara longipes BDJ]